MILVIIRQFKETQKAGGGEGKVPSGYGRREVLGGEDGDGSVARTATARRRALRRPGGEDGGGSAAFPLRVKHQNGVSFGTPLEFQNFTT